MNQSVFMREGVLPSSITLPANTSGSLISFFTQRFPQYVEAVWLSRFERGLIIDQDGHPLSADADSVPGMTVHYFREIVDEPRLPFEVGVVYQDEHLLIADKPHFMATLPVGHYLRDTLLSRLRHQSQNPELVALHRLDRETAGLVLLAKHAASRNAFHALFREKRISKVYWAIAANQPDERFPRERMSHIGADAEHFFRRAEHAHLPPNSHTLMTKLASRDDRALYELRPISGKTHQLRIHMAAEGMPIEHDRLYPSWCDAADDVSMPLQLLAKSVTFFHPFEQREMTVTSSLTLQWK